MTDEERRQLILHVATHPLSGVSIGGGVRKMRFARKGAGKRGGYRVVYFYSPTGNTPIFLIAVFAKNEKTDLTPREAAAIRQLGRLLSETYGRRP